MSTFQELQDLVKTNVARDDAAALLVMKAAINYAATLAALLFEPAELEKDSDLVVSGGSDYADLSSLTNWLDLVRVRNATDNLPMGFIPFELWDLLLPTTVGGTRYYTTFGEKLYVKDGPSVNKTLKIFHSVYPTELVNPADELEFSHHDSYIVSVATGITWAAFEEGESAGMWQQAAQAFTLPLSLGRKARSVIAGKKTRLEQAMEMAKEQG